MKTLCFSGMYTAWKDLLFFQCRSTEDFSCCPFPSQNKSWSRQWMSDACIAPLHLMDLPRRKHKVFLWTLDSFCHSDKSWINTVKDWLPCASSIFILPTTSHKDHILNHRGGGTLHSPRLHDQRKWTMKYNVPTGQSTHHPGTSLCMPRPGAASENRKSTSVQTVYSIKQTDRYRTIQNYITIWRGVSRALLGFVCRCLK